MSEARSDMDVFEGIRRGLETTKARIVLKKQAIQAAVDDEMNDPQSVYLGWPQVIRPYMETITDLNVADQNIINEYQAIVEKLEEHINRLIVREEEYENAERIVAEATAQIDRLEAQVSSLNDSLAVAEQQRAALEPHVPRELLENTEALEAEDARIIALRQLYFQKIKLSENPLEELQRIMRSDLNSRSWPRVIDCLPAIGGLLAGIHPADTDKKRIKLEQELALVPESDWDTFLLQPNRRSRPAAGPLPKNWYTCKECYVSFLDVKGQEMKGPRPERYRPPKRCPDCTTRMKTISKNNSKAPDRNSFIEPLSGLRVKTYESLIGPVGPELPIISFDEPHFAKMFHPNGPGAFEALRAAASSTTEESQEAENNE